MPESGRTGSPNDRRGKMARFPSARKSPAHRPLQCRGSEPYFPVWNGQVAAERPAGSSYACRSGLPWSAAWCACRRPSNRALWQKPTDERSLRTGASKHAVTWKGDLETGTVPASISPSQSRQRQQSWSARSVQTARAAGSFAARPSLSPRSDCRV